MSEGDTVTDIFAHTTANPAYGLFRAYPNNPELRNVIIAQTR